jgi:hypothetical protein
VLKGDELTSFQRERARIDELLQRQDRNGLKVASANKVEG